MAPRFAPLSGTNTPAFLRQAELDNTAGIKVDFGFKVTHQVDGRQSVVDMTGGLR